MWAMALPLSEDLAIFPKRDLDEVFLRLRCNQQLEHGAVGWLETDLFQDDTPKSLAGPSHG